MKEKTNNLLSKINKKKIAVIATAILLIILLNTSVPLLSEAGTTGQRKLTEEENVLPIVANDTYVNADNLVISRKTNDVILSCYKSTDTVTLNEETKVEDAEIYKWNETNKVIYVQDREIDGKTVSTYNVKVKLGSTLSKLQNQLNLYVTYKDGVSIGNETYDLRMLITNIYVALKTGTAVGNKEVIVFWEKSSQEGVLPRIHVTGIDETIPGSLNVQINTTLQILDKNGDVMDFSAIYVAEDIDDRKSVNMYNFDAEEGDKIFVNPALYNAIQNDEEEYKITYNYVGGSYPHAEVSNEYQENIAVGANKPSADIYFFIDNKNMAKPDEIFYRDGNMTLQFENPGIKTYKTVNAKAQNGKIVAENSEQDEYTYTDLKEGNKTIISKANSASDYLKKVTVDGTDVTSSVTKGDNNTYVLNLNVTNNHNVVFEYGQKVTVNFETGVEGQNIEPIKLVPGGKVELPSNLQKQGYAIEKWTIKGTNKTFNFATDTVSEDITLVANWKPVEYTITYELNGGTNNSQNPAKYTIEDNITLAAPTKEGYDFDKWHEKDATQEITEIATGTTGDKTLVAEWTAKQDVAYKVEYYFETTNGKYEKNDSATRTSTAATDATVNANIASFEGYSEDTTNANRKVTGTVKADGSLVLKVYYNKNTYTVSFDTNGAKTEIQDQTVKYNDKATKPTNPEKDGYTFVQWEEKNVSGEFDFTKEVKENKELVAKWEKNEYTITYVLNDGVNNEKNPTKYTITDKVTLEKPSKEGYEFKGWFEDNGFKTEIKSIENRTGNITVYAKFEKIENPTVDPEKQEGQNNQAQPEKQEGQNNQAQPEKQEGQNNQAQPGKQEQANNPEQPNKQEGTNNPAQPANPEKDNTIADGKLPQTGLRQNLTFIIIIATLAYVFGDKYFKLNKIFKF